MQRQKRLMQETLSAYLMCPVLRAVPWQPGRGTGGPDPQGDPIVFGIFFLYTRNGLINT